MTIKFVFTVFLFCIFASKAFSAEEFIIPSASVAKQYTQSLGQEMNTLAEKYKQLSSRSCRLYQDFQYKITHTRITGDFFHADRLDFRLNWYSNPEVDLVDICSNPKRFKPTIYNFLILHAKSIRAFTFGL
jgi:hypothetical protein